MDLKIIGYSESMEQKETKQKICVGYHFGHLTVTEDTGDRKNRYIIWKCLCDCGNSICLDTRHILRHTMLDCGCSGKYGSRKLDLTGKRYGKLVCMYPTEERDQNRSIIWVCQCDCGKTCTVSSGNLRSGGVKSCGCLHNKSEIMDFVGKRFGKLTVVEYAEKKEGMHCWKCLCDCGNETIVGQTLLQSGKTQSCGCLRSSALFNNLKLYNGTSITLLKKKKMKNNTSGYTGVSWNKKSEMWVAKITFQKHTYFLGTYAKIEDAIKARKKGEEMHDDFLEWYNREFSIMQERTEKYVERNA